MTMASSVDIAAAARAARKRDASEGEKETFWVAGSVKELVVVVYSLWLWHKERNPSLLLLVRGRSRQELGEIVSILKVLKVSACSIHAMSSNSAGVNSEVVAACDDAWRKKRKHLNRLLDGKLLAVIRIDRGETSSFFSTAVKEVVCCWDDGKKRRHPVSKDEGLKTTSRSRCQLGFAMSQSKDVGEYLAARNRLEVALHTSSPSQQKVTRRKMILLGMISEDHSSSLPKSFSHGTHNSFSSGCYREVARTRYLDRGIPEKRFLSEAWLGDQRTGAFADRVSFRIAKCVRERKSVAMKWRPNPEGDGWGGKFGKACAHNEVCLHCVRPFVPLEVVNTRMCSRARPAPGNDGYDGCLEFLREQCRRRRRPQTVWDVDDFVWISARGEVSFLSKKTLLESFSLPRLEFFVPVLRDFTLLTRGRASPNSLIRLIDHLLSVGLGREYPDWWPRLPVPCSRLVVAFLVGGHPAVWRQASS